MPELNRRNFLTGAATLGAAAAFSVAAIAQEATVETIATVPTHLDIAEQSIQYSQESGGVGIIMSYGAWEGAPSSDFIGERLVSMFEERGSEAKYFVIPNDDQGLAVSYTTYDVGIGPFNPQDALANIDKAIEMNRTARELQVSALSLEN